MENGLLYKNIDMDRFIEKRLLEIENLEERKEARQVMSQIFKELYQYASDKIQILEEEIEKELKTENEFFSIYTGISTKYTYDITEGSMFPMRKEDLEKIKIPVKELLEALSEKKEVSVFTIFLELSYEEIMSLQEQNREFKGYIHTENSEYPICVQLKPSKRYHETMKKLFQVVVNNGFAWNTVCTAYLNKFFDVYLTEARMDKEEEIDYIEIDFEEYREKVKYDCFPVWNIEAITCASEVKKVACLDQVQYQHLISKHYLKDGTYLVADEETMLTRRKAPEGIIITMNIPETKKWNLYRIVDSVGGYPEYPYLCNGSKDVATQPARTKGDVFRIVNALNYSEYMVLKEIVFPLDYQGKILTYSMDRGITEEFQVIIERQPMVLQFVKLQEKFISNDILSYIITVVQRKYPEYCCYGEFLKDGDR